MLLPPPFDGIDHRRLERHETLLSVWRGCDPQELIADMQLLISLLQYAQHRHEVLAMAKAAHIAGGTHDCGEWLDDDRNCQLCGHRVMRQED